MCTKKELSMLLLPLLLIPANLYAVLMLGQDAGNMIIGAAFLVALAKFANKKERRFMVILAIFAIIFETANVALGLYAYKDAIAVPAWIGLGWGVVGIYLLHNIKLFRKISDKIAYAMAILCYAGIWILTGTGASNIVPFVFAVLSVYALRLASSRPASFFLSAGLLGVIIEFFGTSFGIWSYFDWAGRTIAPNYGALALAYSSVVAFALWLSRVEE